MSSDVSPPPLKRRRLGSSAILQGIPKDTLTVYSWNVNGVGPFIQQPITSFFQRNSAQQPGNSGAASGHDAARQPSPSLREFLRRHNWPTMLFLQEIKINPEDKTTIAAVQRAVQRQKTEDAQAPNYTAHFCLPSDQHNARGFGRKVYGVCSIIRDDFHARCVTAVRPVSWDQEGRFLVTETRATDTAPKLAIINCYAVNGTENAYRDPQTGRPSGTRHDRKLRVHALLQDECRRLESEGFACIIAGDINVARTTLDGYPSLRTFPKQHCINRADFEARFFREVEGQAGDDLAFAVEPHSPSSGLGMIDTFRHLHPQRRGYTYYPRTRAFGDSCDRVDMVLISKRLGRYLKAAGMHETATERGPSDHVPLYATLDFGSADAEDT